MLLMGCALCSVHGAVPSTPLAYYTPSAAQYMTRSGNGDPNDEPYTVIKTEMFRATSVIHTPPRATP